MGFCVVWSGYKWATISSRPWSINTLLVEMETLHHVRLRYAWPVPPRPSPITHYLPHNAWDRVQVREVWVHGGGPRAVQGDDEAGRWINAGGGAIELGFHGLGRGNSNELLWCIKVVRGWWEERRQEVTVTSGRRVIGRVGGASMQRPVRKKMHHGPQ
jgi:hypothetical protein